MFLRDYCVDWIIGWVACWIAFMSVFFTLKKLVLKGGMTPPRYLLDTLLSVEILQLFLIAFPTAPRYLVDRSRKLLPPRQLLDTWWIDRASVLGFNELFFNTYSIPTSIPTSIASSAPLDTCIYRVLLRVYIYFLRDPFLISSICPHLFISQTLSLSLQTFSFVIFQAFSRFFFSW